MKDIKEITVLGSGSWATALVKILLDSSSGVVIHWYLRNPSYCQAAKSGFGTYPFNQYLKLPSSRLRVYSFEDYLSQGSIILHAIPAAYSEIWYRQIKFTQTPETVISAAKGVIPEKGQSALEWLASRWPQADIFYLGGPCHSEEVVKEMRSYLTLAGVNIQKAKQIIPLFQTHYLSLALANNPQALELSGILKNIMAIAMGLAIGLGYGDNFQAILISAAFREIQRIASAKNSLFDGWLASSGAFLGDLLVTCYSIHSRNRRFGYMLAEGKEPKTALSEMGMVPEGYYVLQAWQSWLSDEDYPISRALCKILFERKLPKDEFKILESQINSIKS